MDVLLVALGLALILVVGLCWAGWWLVSSSRQERQLARAVGQARQRERLPSAEMGKFRRPACAQSNDDDDEDLFVTVPRLLAQAIQAGEGLRLPWANGDLKVAGRVRPYVQNQLPTARLPKVG